MSALSDLRDDLNGLGTSLSRLFGGGDRPSLELKPGQVVVDQSEIDTLKAQIGALQATLAHAEEQSRGDGTRKPADGVVPAAPPGRPGEVQDAEHSSAAAGSPTPADVRPATHAEDVNPPSGGALLPENAISTTPPGEPSGSPSNAGGGISTNDEPANPDTAPAGKKK